MNIKKTANLLINFAIKRLAEILGIIVFFSGILLFISLFSYSPEDPNFIFPDNTKITNILGFKGSFTSDLFFQSIGLTAYLVSLTFIVTGVNILRTKDFFLIIENIFYSIIYSVFCCVFFTYFYTDAFTLYINGNGGFIGLYLNQTFINTQQAPSPVQSSFEVPAKLASKISQFIKGEIALIIMNNIRRVKKALKLLELMFLFNLSKNLIPLNSILIR